MSDLGKTKTDFEKAIDLSFDLAVGLHHEYVVVEHILAAILETDEMARLCRGLSVDLTALKTEVADYLADENYHSVMSESSYQPKYTTTLMFVIKQAKTQSLFLGKSQITVMDILMSMFTVENSQAQWLLNKNNITRSTVADYLSNSNSAEEKDMSETDAIMILSQFATNLNHKNREDSSPLIGRDDDIAQLVETVSRRFKKSVALIGAPGVGKTQLVEGLARRIALKQVPENLLDQEIWSLDVNSLVAGTKFRGDFEDRMKALITAVKSLPKVILFIDEMHMIMGAGAGGGQNPMDAANILKPALGRGEIRVIGSTTTEEFRKYFEKDRALMRRFQRQDVAEPTPEQAKEILAGLISGFEKYHGVRYDETCAAAAVDLSVKYIINRHLPDKAIDLIDAAGSAVKVRMASGKGVKTVLLADIEQQISKIAKISLESVDTSDSQKLLNLEASIKTQLMGQDTAVTAMCDAVLMAYSGLRASNRTMGSFLLTGPSGVGKTSMAQSLAEQLGYAFLRFDMSEFIEPHSIARLIGSPPGYVGYNDGAAGGGALINALENTPSCVLLIDEVEKAHPDVLNIFLQAMDRGEITSQNQKTVSLRNVFLIFTSNLGATVMEKHTLGFGAGVNSDREAESFAAVKRFFAPEFRNRLDAVISFSPLGKTVMRDIVDKFVVELNKLALVKNVQVMIDAAASDWLADQGYDSSLGARPLSRVIDTNIKKPMSREILFGSLVNGGTVDVTVDQDTNKLKLEYKAT